MQKIVCIFAHPDDEAFGPGGTIALLAKEYEVHVICVTDGSAGENSLPDSRSLGDIRLEELKKSAAVLGVKSVIPLGYADGKLCNNLYHEIGAKIENVLRQLQPETLLTFEPHGVSGHIDHITVSFITSYLFAKLQFIQKVMYYCLHEDQCSTEQNYFVFLPSGYQTADIGETYTIAPVWETKKKAMRVHKSQAKDYRRILNRHTSTHLKEHFLVKKR